MIINKIACIPIPKGAIDTDSLLVKLIDLTPKIQQTFYIMKQVSKSK